jgi:hypothetical protein
MKVRLFALALIGSAACGRPYAPPANVTAAAPPADVFQCAKQKLGEMGYKQSSIDTDALRVNATKIDWVSRRSDVQFRRFLNKIAVEVSPGADGQTVLETTGHTFAEYTTQRGPTEVEETPSDTVKNDVRQLTERCRS